jgi:hypothetical protein
MLALAGEGLEDGHDDLSVATQSLAVQGVAQSTTSGTPLVGLPV